MASGRQVQTTEEFIAKAIARHGNAYDYSSVDYTAWNGKVKIFCNRRKVFFWQTPTKHLSMKVGGTARGLHSLDGNIFIERSTLVHSGKYSYDKLEYKNTKTNVTITCPVHGDFSQLPGHHMSGFGCRRCGHDTDSTKKRPSVSSRISQSKRIHGSKYDYSLVDLDSKENYVPIICKEHGVFHQDIKSHSTGTGCPVCKNSKGERFVALALDKHGVQYERQWKPGVNGNRRLSFDFIVEDSLVIEVDGKQHFEPIEAFGGVRAFHKNVGRDLIKTRWAIDNGYKILRIPYWDLVRIPEIIEQAVMELGLCQAA